MTTSALDSLETETLRYLWTPDLDPLFWREGRAGVLSAWYGHVPFAHWIVGALKPRTLVELGTHNGVSYSAFCEAVVCNGLDTRCFAVDTWHGDEQAGYYGEEVYRDLRRFHDERYSAFSELLRCTFDDAVGYIPDASVDLLHIDGLHTYEAVQHDFENWRRKLSDSAVVLFHDTNVRQSDFGVWRLWEELRTLFPSFEFLHGHGLGVLAIGRSVSTQVAALCSLRDPQSVHTIRQRFSLLGERWTRLDPREQPQAGEIADRDSRIASLGEEIAARDSRILSLEAEATRRSTTEAQLRSRAAQRSAQARAEAAKATADLQRAANQTFLLSPSDVAAETVPGAPLPEANKRQILQELRQRVAVFLASGHRLSFPKADAPDISVIIVLFNQAQFTLHCLRAVLAQAAVNVEIILVDNNSTDETAELLGRLDNVQVLRNQQNIGFVMAVNQAAAAARGRTILLLNSDAFLRENALAIALETLDSDPAIGAVGGRLILPSGELQEAGSIVWSDASAVAYGRGLLAEAGEIMFRRDVDYCSGAFLLTRRELFERLGRLDSFYAPAYYEEADYCLRLWQTGMRVVYEPRAVVDHYEFGSQTRSNEATELCMRNRKRLRLRHAFTLQSHHLPPSDGNVLFARDHARTRRRLLVVDNEVPFRWLGRGNPRMGALINEAVAAGWFVTLYPILSGKVDWEAAHAEFSPEIEICYGRCAPGLPAFLDERQGYYDVVLVSRPENMMLFKEVVCHRPHVLAGARLIYDAEALSAVRSIAKAELQGRSMGAEETDALIKEELDLTAGVDSIVTVTLSEAQVFRSRQPAPVYLVGHPARVVQDTPDFTLRGGFLFVGRLLEKDAPNYEGLNWFIQTIWPRIHAALSGVTLTVAGPLHPEPNELNAPGVRLIGPVEDLQPLYARARVFVSPVRFAAGVPIKILDAAAAGLPVIGTKLMAKLLGWEPGVEIEATDDPAEMANAAIALHNDSSRWEAMRIAGFNRLLREHSEATFRNELRALLEENDHSVARPTEPNDAMEAHRISRVNTVWSAAGALNGRDGYWMANRVVRACVNRRASGDPAQDSYARLVRLLTEMGWTLPAERAVSMCCGTGELERGLAGLGIARRIIGYDLAETAIAKARAQAGIAGLSQVEYEVRDLERDGLGQRNVDVIFAHSAVHHISRLEELFDEVHAALRPGGIFHLNEYVGPDRFQWTDRQMAEINDFLESLPDRYRRLPGGGLRSRLTRPTVAEMLRHDPSEAVRSSEIEALVVERFHIVERRALGGTLLHMALHDIAQNFDPDENEDQARLQRLIDREDQLMADGGLGSDFLVLVAQRKE